MLPLPGTAENGTLQDSTTPMASAADRRRGNGARTGARDSPSGATVSRETVFRGPRRLDHYGPMSESVGTTNRGPFDWAERAANTRVVSARDAAPSPMASGPQGLWGRRRPPLQRKRRSARPRPRPYDAAPIQRAEDAGPARMPTGWWCRSATSAGSESPPEQEFDASSQRQRSFHVKQRARDPDVATSRQRRGRWGVCIGRDPDTAGVIGRRSTPAPNHPAGSPRSGAQGATST